MGWPGKGIDPTLEDAVHGGKSHMRQRQGSVAVFATKSVPEDHVQSLICPGSRALFFLPMLLLALVLTLGGCMEDKEEGAKDAPAATVEAKAGDSAGDRAEAEPATPPQTAGAVVATADRPAEAGENAAADASESTAANADTGTGEYAPLSGEAEGVEVLKAGAAEAAEAAEADEPVQADEPGGTDDAADAGLSKEEAREEGGTTADGKAEAGAGEDAGEGAAEESTEEAPQKGDDELTEEEKLEAAKALWPPVKELVTSPFGEHRGSIVPLLSDAPMKSRHHGGLDLRGHLGWPVRSLEDGKVVMAGPGGNAGIMVKIEQTDGKSVAYAHLGEVLVKSGDEVKKGQHIGKVGCTGRTTGAHLHISVRDEKGNLVNPEKEIEGLWEVYDPPLADLREPINSQACGRVYGGVNRRLQGQKQYLRMRKALLGNEYKVPDSIPSWGSSQ